MGCMILLALGDWAQGLLFTYPLFKGTSQGTSMTFKIFSACPIIRSHTNLVLRASSSVGPVSSCGCLGAPAILSGGEDRRRTETPKAGDWAYLLY